MSPSREIVKKIPFCEPWFSESYAECVRKQVLSGWIGPGPATAAFGEAISRYVSARYCVLTLSGTLALSVAAKALGLKAGDEILVPAYGVVSTINAFASFGLSPRLVDIECGTGCLSPKALRERIRPRTRAVCFVNFSGYTGPDLREVRSIAEERGIFLIEDAACAFGNRFQGQFAGTFGHVGTYSFSIPKVITTGQGGAMVTDTVGYYERALAFIDQGDLEWRKTNLIRGIGNNLRYNDILAALGRAQLEEIETRMARKRAAYEGLRRRLGRKIFQLPEDQVPLHYIVFARERERLLKFLGEQGIQAVWQYRTLTEHPPYAGLRDEEFPQADHWTRHAVYLPFGLSLEPRDAERIADALTESGVELLDIS
jgi:perosamine synthetase